MLDYINSQMAGLKRQYSEDMTAIMNRKSMIIVDKNVKPIFKRQRVDLGALKIKSCMKKHNVL